jgi:hypothetical protein
LLADTGTSTDVHLILSQVLMLLLTLEHISTEVYSNILSNSDAMLAANIDDNRIPNPNSQTAGQH